MSENRMDPRAYIEDAAALLGIDTRAADLDLVARNFRNFMQLSEIVQNSGENEPLDPLGVYRP